ncbi:MAG: glycoside hydrolase family 31 protein [Chitinophagaceae bacterium]|nr:glycoside hydrolase family 31 protein [Chitinophagaceae bacterium]
MKKILLAICSMIVLFANAQFNRLSEQIGSVKKVTAYTKNNRICYAYELTNAFAEISFINATTVRVRVTKEKPTSDFSFAIENPETFNNFNVAEDNIGETGAKSIYTTAALKVEIQNKPFRINIYNNNGKLLCGDDANLGISWFGNQISCYKKLHSDEKFIGLGEKTGGINRRGNFYSNWNSDVPAYATNADPLYSTIPFFIGIHDSSTYGIFFDNTHKSYFNFGGGADEEIFHFGADDGEMNYYFFGGNSVAKIIQDYTALTGRTPMPPLWSLGFQQSRWGYDNPEQLLNIAKTFREQKLPADVIVSDINYMDNYKIFTWSKKFTDVKGMMTNMKQMGFDMVTIIDPGIKIEKGYKAYEEGLAQKLFVTYPNGKEYIGHVWPGRCHFPDFTKETTLKWWGNSFKDAYVNNGIKGFWNDMNEPAAWGREFPNLIEFGEGKNKKTLFTVKNAYGLLMSKATHEGTKSLMNGQRPFVLTRAAYSGIQKYAAQWTGDNVSSDEHMLLGFRLLNSMGVSGVPYVGMDIGGFIGNPSPELFIRWLSLAVYSPLFRNHTHIGYNFREPWLFGEFNTIKIRKILEQRYQLLPYLYSSFYQAHTTGIPINRMLPIEYTFDNLVYDGKYENQFLFGNQILVAPCTSTQTITEVYLPGNLNWYKQSNDKLYKGGESYLVKTPLEDLPVFIKEGSILPMQNTIQHTKEKGDGILYLHVYKGIQPTNFMYYEDDGETYNYEKNIFYKRNIVYDALSNKLLLEKKEGSFTSKFNTVKIVLHGFQKNATLSFNLKDDAMIVDLAE